MISLPNFDSVDLSPKAPVPKSWTIDVWGSPTDEQHMGTWHRMAPAPPPQIGIESSGPRNVWSKPGAAGIAAEDGQVTALGVARLGTEPWLTPVRTSELFPQGWVSDMFMGCGTTAENTCLYVTIPAILFMYLSVCLSSCLSMSAYISLCIYTHLQSACVCIYKYVQTVHTCYSNQRDKSHA